MKRLNAKVKDRYSKGLERYICHRDEEYLTNAYNMGRQAAQKGVSELDLISYHHDRLVELNRLNLDLDYEQIIQRASDYLKECMASFEVKLGGYREVINELQEKNELLEKEINNRKEAQEELFRSKEHFRSLIENAQDIITVLDHTGIIRYSSPSIERILGYSHGELVGSDAFRYVHENDVEEVKELFNDVITIQDKTVTAEFRFQHKNNGWVYLESIAKNVENGQDGPVVIVNSRDVTERNRAVRKLEEHKIQLSDAQQIAKVGSWEWKPQQDEVRWSDEMCRIYGLNPEDCHIAYKTFINFIHPGDVSRFENTVEKALKEESSFSIEHRIIRTDGKTRNLLCRGNIVRNEDGEVVKMVGTGQDITDQKKKEQRLREYSKQLRNLSEKIERAREEERIRIARQVHDELGQMLTVLKMDVSILQEEMEEKIPDDDRETFNTQAAKVLERINVIIKSVQTITTELRPEVLDDLGLKEAIDWQANEFKKRTDINISFNTQINETNFLDDEKATTLFRIFQETLTNVARHANASEVEIELKKRNGNLYLVVSDDGVGITEEQKNASSSLGIIGMRERTQFLGGDVKIEGTKKEGTTVTLQLPLNGDK